MTPPSPQLRIFHELNGKTFLVGVGANKCATSWVYTYLRGLPDVAVSPLKEVHFFNSKVPSPSAGEADLHALKRVAYHFAQEGDVVDNLRARPAFQASLERARMIYDDNAYLEHFASLCRPQTRTLCDITPAYSALGQVGFQYMKAFLASQDVRLKVFFIMRDPVDRLWSHMRYRDRNDPELDLLKNWPKMVEDLELMAWSDYRDTVEALEAVFAEDDLLFLFYEDLFEEEALKGLTAFADAVHAPPSSTETVNETALKIALPDEVGDELRNILDPQYAFCRKRFGGTIPASWRA